MMQYAITVRHCIQWINRSTLVQKILRETLVDTVGGHLRSELLPSARLAYYAGYVPYKNVRELHEFYDELKLILNTQGQGWKTGKSASIS